MLKLLSSAGLILLLAGCQSSSSGVGNLTPGQFEEPAKAGETKVRLNSVDPEKWVARADNSSTATRTVFVCRPLACSSQSTVVYTRSASPTRKPDRTALEKVLADKKAKASNDGIVTTGSSLTSFRGFQTIVAEYNREDSRNNGKTNYYYEKTIFAGSLVLKVTGISNNPTDARKYHDEFVSKIVIRDGGSAAQ